ncbi:MAG: UDP-N-acetylmuramoyl-L-alanine--D-glutamate ligase [Anaerolineales bacterium]
MMIDWTGQRVLIIGAARQGTALARYLASHGAQVVVNDRRSADDLQNIRSNLSDLPIRWVLGEHPLSLLDTIDLICPSGGVPLTLPIIIEAQKRGISLSNDSQIFLESAPCKVIGITGSAGKTTTTSLVGRIANESIKHDIDSSCSSKVWVGGNIGNPLIANLEDIQDDDLVVMELSSFQLEIMTCSPHVASILNITPNHLDRHGTMAAYIAAKARILEFQQESDIAVLGSDDPQAWKLADSVKGKLISFGFQRPSEGQVGCFLNGDQIEFWNGETAQILFTRDTIHLRGGHNIANVLAACAIAYAAGIPIEYMRTGVDHFTGIPHRLEFVRSWGGADWYNDSIATAPERTIAAIQSFDEPLVLLLGGRDKDLPWDDLAILVNERVKHVILFGEAADLIGKAIDLHKGTNICSVTHLWDLKQAVQAAAELVKPGDIVLLSPGGTSFDAFRDFAERGEQFRVWVNELE